MTVNFVLFFVLAAACIATAIGMLVSRNAIYAALFLVLNFGTVAVFYILLNAPFIAMAQITVYAGAIMVLFLFVIMLLGSQDLPQSNVLPWQRPLAIAIAVLLVAEAGLLLVSRAGPVAIIPPAVGDFGTPQSIGNVLFSNYLLPFEITSVLLLVAMVGAIILTLRDKGGR